MLLNSKVEFRGCSIRYDDKKNEYHYCNVEDVDGDSAKFQCSLDIDLKQFKKGDNVNITLEYNVKYGSLKVVDIKK